MKISDYDNELMDQYIEKAFPEFDKQVFSERDRKLIADSLGFNIYCLNVAWNEFVDSLIKTLRDFIKRIRRQKQ